MEKSENIILKNPSLYEFVQIGLEVDDIIAKINAFDWLDLAEAETNEAYFEVIERVFNKFKFSYKPKFDTVVKTAFTKLFSSAVADLKESIVAVSKSYNIEGSKTGFRNEIVDRFYYINYWADKKNIPVNYNEKDEAKRDLFNLDTIILSILADKLKNFNEYEQQKAARK